MTQRRKVLVTAGDWPPPTGPPHPYPPPPRGGPHRPAGCLVCRGEKDSGLAWVCGACREPHARAASKRRQARRRARLRIARAWRLSRPHVYADPVSRGGGSGEFALVNFPEEALRA